MGMTIRTNVGSLNAQRNLYSTQNSLNTSLAKLSSGFRITKAGDDAAGLAISEVLRSQITGLNQASKNAQDAISMIQTAEGAMQEVHSMMQRMNQLAMQASNATLSPANRKLINLELQQLTAEVNSVADRVSFNGQKLLNGNLTSTLDATSELKVGSALATTVAAHVSKIDVTGAAAGTFTLSSTAAGKLTLTNAAGVSQTVDVNPFAATGGTQKFDFSQLGISFEVVSGGAKTAADLITDLTAGANDTIVTAGTGAAQFQIGPNAADTLSVQFNSIKIDAGNAPFAALATALTNFNGAQTAANATALIGALETSINAVSEMRANLGAAQNRLDHTIENINVTSENLSASESRIRDADVAQETAEMTKAQILMQAGVSVLAQANQMPQMTLKLLG